MIVFINKMIKPGELGQMQSIPKIEDGVFWKLN